MNIAFICGSLEPGKDGVGDYTRRLASALIERGNAITIIAFNDRYVSETVTGQQESDGIKIDIVRLSARDAITEKLNVADKVIKEFRPDWISLQYVPFSYQKKGLPWQLGNQLKSISKGISWHIMFHELWCGMNPAAPVKEKILGYGQKNVLKKLVRSLKPSKIFTNINSYGKRLNNYGITPVKVVPIFGNIPLNSSPPDNVWQSFIADNNINALINAENNVLLVGFFGAVYPCEGLDELMVNIQSAANNLKKRLLILFIGHGNREQVINHFGDIITSEIKNLGALDFPLLNKVFSLIDISVVTTPSDGMNKSGSAIAWIERGVPVLISAKDKSYNSAELEKDKVYQVFNAGDVEKAIKSGKSGSHKSRLDMVADFYFENLK
jgi:hypothetical protein